MAKRVRGSSRPGQRRPVERRRTAPAASAAPATPAAPRSTGLTEAETARAAELEAQLLAEERAAEQSRRRSRDRAVTGRDVTPGGSITLRAEEEYAYVARDVKEIVRIALILFTILAVLYIVIDVAKTVTIT